MAHATNKICEFPQPPKIEVGIELYLTADEASTLARILQYVGGHNKTSPRRFVDAIYMALMNAGVKPLQVVNHGGDFYFADTFTEKATAAYDKAGRLGGPFGLGLPGGVIPPAPPPADSEEPSRRYFYGRF